MSFSQEWDQRYQQNTHLSIWPWSDVVSFVMRYARPSEKPLRVLELGCGAGANIPFFLAIGADYHAIEGSPTIVEKLHERFPLLQKQIVVGDFTKTLPFAGEFDLILDRGSLTCNDCAAIHSCLEMMRTFMRPSALFIGIDWYSTACSEYGKGTTVEDSYTRTGFPEGPLRGIGQVHFTDKSHLLETFSKFEILVMEHKIIHRDLPEDGWNFASWNLVARKPT